MRNTLFVVGVLGTNFLLILPGRSAPVPGPKRPGPSAVEAARLKKNPPPNYLSHYLPDDRYKIAGGVWKYVSTDLDTYYHVPSSPNMLRQPANRVIGFANARDAEEAGYVADPTDGTSRTLQTIRPSATIRPQTERRHVLPDGRATIILPLGWTVIDENKSSGTMPDTNQPYTGGFTHLVYKGNLENTLLISSMKSPNRDMVKESRIVIERGKVPGAKAIKVGNLAGSIYTLPAALGGPETITVSLAQGNTMYNFFSTKKNASLPGFYNIVKSLRVK